MKKILAFLLLILLSFSYLSAQNTNKPHSAKKASTLSAILPGAGQVYNKQAWKIPIIYAGAGAVSYFAITNYQNSIKFKNEYYNRIEGNTADLLSDYTKYSDENILSLYEAYNKNFQLSLVIGAAVYLLNIIDAMVYGHLYEFNIDDNLTAKITPFYLPPTHLTNHNFGINLSISIK
ncbi:MAG: DUF5683 domain-containing protein [Bacteroidales bacterium]|jgi:hypothetical protein|nr:hypothetical protein [Bacteroidales bacterium]MEE0883028.1 DUF5683 domain-containing protein [Bacteroidales bacterium]MEE1020991.1 DUF5683 domain-containing protein [Bacteroidales bacterium]MEE1251607.1 DUF5683 domain-containing protein [Bacteroidales bacterium]